MKIKLHYIAFSLAAFALFSCKKDNYDAPSSMLSGKLVYQGETFGLEKDQVPFELYQYGFGKVGPIGSSFAQDGTYSASLFDGEYKLIIPNGQGPFVWKKNGAGNPDSLAITLRGNTALDLEVMPYYLIKSPQITASGGTINASFQIAQIITGADAKEIDNVTLYVNKTQFVSGGNNNAAAGKGGGDITDPSNVTLSVAVPSMTPTQNYVYVRIGLRISGIEDMIFSPLQKLSL